MQLLIPIAIAVTFMLAAIMVFASIYNRLVTLQNRCKNAFAQIDVQLRRRYDLIPNLVECVKSYMTHERETLENVIAARNQAASGLASAAKNPTNAAALQQWMGAEGALTGALGRLSMVMEAYPDLQANETVTQLTEELTSTEDRISFSRQNFNDLVTVFNTYRQQFPTILLAPSFGFKEDLPMLEIAEKDQIQRAPQVSLV